MRVWTEEEVARFLEAARRSKHYPLFVLALSTHATILLRKGVQPKVVAERLGHASVKVTLDTYSHVLPDTQHEAVKAIENVLWTGAVLLFVTGLVKLIGGCKDFYELEKGIHELCQKYSEGKIDSLNFHR